MAKSDKNVKKPIVIPSNADERKKALDAAVAHIEKAYGKGAIMKLGEKRHVDVDVIPTGSLTLDMALGIGGVPRGRIVEIYGPESSGKTTVALHIVAEAQKMGGNAAYIDVEHALDPVYAKALGVDIDNLLISQPDSGEQALEIAESLARSAAIDVLVIDSVAAMVTKAEIDGLMGDNHVGQLARLMSAAMRKLTSVIARSNCVAIFINQIREKIGTVYGNPETTPGGRALKFYASVRIEVRKGKSIKEGDEVFGTGTNCKIVKNKVAPPFKTCSFDIMYGKGISRTGEVLDLAVDYEVVKKGGAWFSFNDEKLGQGRDNVKELFEQKPELMKEIEEKLKEAIAKEELDIAEGKKVTPKKAETSKKAKDAAKKAALENGDDDGFEDSVADDTDEMIEATAENDGYDMGDDDEDENFEEFTPINTEK